MVVATVESALHKDGVVIESRSVEAVKLFGDGILGKERGRIAFAKGDVDA